jgi:hypothetical protein
VQAGNHQPVGNRVDNPLTSGPVYAFDLTTGQPLWPAPAHVHERGLVPVGPHDLPFVVFADRAARRAAGEGALKLRLLCLDKWTGQTVYRNDDLPDVSEMNFRVRIDRGPSGAPDASDLSVVIQTGSREFRLTPTDEPRPPEPPPRDELVADREIPARGLRGALQRATDALQDAEKQDASRRGRGARPGR